MLTRCSRDLRYRYVSDAYAKMAAARRGYGGEANCRNHGQERARHDSPYIEKGPAGKRADYEAQVSFKNGERRSSAEPICRTRMSAERSLVGLGRSSISQTKTRRGRFARL